MRNLTTLILAGAIATSALGCDASSDGVASDVSAGQEVASDTAAGPDTSSEAAADATPADVSIEDTASSDTLQPDDTSADTEASAADTVQTQAVAGRYGQLQVQSSISSFPFVGDTNSTTRTLLLVDIEPAGDGYQVTQTVCDVTLDSGTDLVSTILPDAAVAAIGTSQRGATLDGASFEANLATEVWGATLSNPVSDSLPSEPNDPRVVDHESDGKPGMTVRVTGLLDGEIYVVQRGWTTLRGTFDGADRIDGLVEWGQEQIILGADNALLESPVESAPDSDPAASWFRTTRVDAQLDCAALIAQADALFAR